MGKYSGQNFLKTSVKYLKISYFSYRQKKISRVKKGHKQPFSKFWWQYKFKFMQCKENAWKPLIKIIYLNNRLNSSLKKALIRSTCDRKITTTYGVT